MADQNETPPNMDTSGICLLSSRIFSSNIPFPGSSLKPPPTGTPSTPSPQVNLLHTQLEDIRQRPPEEGEVDTSSDGETESQSDDQDNGASSDADTASYDGDFVTNINLTDLSHLIETQAARSKEIITDQLESRPIKLQDLQDTMVAALQALNVSILH